MVKPRIASASARRCRSLLLIFAACNLFTIASCTPGGPPPQFASLFITAAVPEIGQANVPCILTGTNTPCPPPVITFSGTTSAAATNGNATCFRAVPFGVTPPPPPCSNVSGVTVTWGDIGIPTTSSGWIINASASNLQPGSWTVALKSAQPTVIPNASCVVTISLGTHTMNIFSCSIS
jgi:hypothetical protein